MLIFENRSSFLFSFFQTVCDANSRKKCHIVRLWLSLWLLKWPPCILFTCFDNMAVKVFPVSVGSVSNTGICLLFLYLVIKWNKCRIRLSQVDGEIKLLKAKLANKSVATATSQVYVYNFVIQRIFYSGVHFRNFSLNSVADPQDFFIQFTDFLYAIKVSIVRSVIKRLNTNHHEKHFIIHVWCSNMACYEDSDSFT